MSLIKLVGHSIMELFSNFIYIHGHNARNREMPDPFQPASKVIMSTEVRNV